MLIIDAHSHFLPDTVIDHIRKHKDRFRSEIVVKDGREFVWDYAGALYPLYREYYDAGAKIADLDKMGIDMAVLSLVPNAYYYWIEPEAALEIHRMSNDWVSDFCAARPGCFRGMISVPMQDPGLALQELRRGHEALGMNALAIAPMINETHLDAEAFYPIYEYCADHGVLLHLHPCFPRCKEELTSYYNINLVGNVYQTSLGLNHLIFGGIFEKYPGLQVFASHGGGYFPYQMGRLRHGYSVREEPHAHISKSPEQYAGHLYFDTITHWTAALQFLTDQFGSDHVMIGTDYPFDMGDYQPVEHVEALRLTAQERKNIFGENAAKLFRI